MSNRTFKATEARVKKGKDLSDTILKILKKHPQGLTLYGLSKLYKSSPGAILGAIERVIDKLEFQEFEKENRRIKLYFLKGILKSNLETVGLIELDKNNLDQKLWKHNAMVYGVGTETIEILPKEEPKYKNFLKGVVLLHQKKESIEFVLPQTFIDFYHLNENKIIIIPSKDKVVITITKQITRLEITQKRVLILDDENNQIIKNIKEVLGKRHKVEYKNNLEDAIPIIKKEKPDFIILDWTLRDSPKEHTQLLRELEHNNPKERAIIITAHSYERDDVENSIKKGFSWFFSKYTQNLPEVIQDEMSSVLY